MHPEKEDETYSDSEDSSVGLLSRVEAGLSEKDILRSNPRRKRFSNFAHKILQVSWIYVKNFLIFLLPSFIASRLPSAADSKEKPRQVRSIAFLDGLRGFAAWAVFNAHLCPNITRTAGASWSHQGGWEWWRFPVFKLLYNPVMSVGLFFVVGGLTCSLSVVAAMNQNPRKSGTALEKAAASSFKRPLRLLLPSFAAMAVAFVLIRLNFFEPLRSADFTPVIDNWAPVKDWPARNPSLWGQTKDLFSNMLDILEVWTPTADRSWRLAYYPPLWTIKCELRASLMLFILHQALFFMKRRARLLVAFALIVVGIATSATDMPAFIAGYMIAEYLQANPLQKVNRRFFLSFLWWLLVFFGIFLGVYPSWDDLGTPSHAWLRGLTPFHFEPHDRFWGYLGAVLFVLAISRTQPLMRFFSSPLAMYLSQISYSLYLVHFWMVQTVGVTMFYYAWLWTGKDTFIQTYLGFILAYPVVLFLTIWVADIFARAVDAPMANLIVKLQKWCFKE